MDSLFSRRVAQAHRTAADRWIAQGARDEDFIAEPHSNVSNPLPSPRQHICQTIREEPGLGREGRDRPLFLVENPLETDPDILSKPNDIGAVERSHPGKEGGQGLTVNRFDC